MMKSALSRLVSGSCSLLAGAALGLGALGTAVPPMLERLGRAEPQVAAEALVPVDPGVQVIDEVLARRSPHLGLALRRRVAEAIAEESRRADFDPLFVLGLIQAESDFDGQAISVAGARGLMQLRPGTLVYLARGEGLRLSADELYRDPALQVRLGVRYLARLVKQFGTIDLALMAYNTGPGNLKRSLARGDVERFKGYVQTVKRNHGRFRRSLGLLDGSELAQR